MYTGTHLSFRNILIHRNHAVTLILRKDIVMIWYERLLYLGVRTRIIAGGEEDIFKVNMRLFRTYVKNYK